VLPVMYRETSLANASNLNAPSLAGRALGGMEARWRTRASRAIRTASPPSGTPVALKPCTPRAASQSQHRARAVNAIKRDVTRALTYRAVSFSRRIARKNRAIRESRITWCALVRRNEAPDLAVSRSSRGVVERLRLWG